MAYATVQDLIDRFSEQELVELTDLDNLPPTTVDEARVTQAIDDAANVIDGYIGQVYRLPLRGCADPDNPGVYTPPPQLTRLCCDLARFYLHKDRAPDREVSSRAKASRDELDLIARGKTQLACPLGGEPGDALVATGQTSNETAYSFGCPVFSDDALRGF
jgi:phage gp36-like protein